MSCKKKKQIAYRKYRCAACGEPIKGLIPGRPWGWMFRADYCCTYSCMRKLERDEMEKTKKCSMCGAPLPNEREGYLISGPMRFCSEGCKKQMRTMMQEKQKAALARKKAERAALKKEQEATDRMEAETMDGMTELGELPSMEEAFGAERVTNHVIEELRKERDELKADLDQKIKDNDWLIVRVDRLEAENAKLIEGMHTLQLTIDNANGTIVQQGQKMDAMAAENKERCRKLVETIRLLTEMVVSE